MKNFWFVLMIALSLTVIGSGLSAQAKLIPSTTPPKVDGMIAAKEYAYVTAGNGITFAVALSLDGKTLYACLSAPTSGWVAIGLGSLRMNKSFIVMGYDSGKSTISEQSGVGQSHSPATKKLLIEAVAKKSEALTTLEMSLPAEGFTKSGKLEVILAYGDRADFVSMHRWKTSFPVPIGIGK